MVTIETQKAELMQKIQREWGLWYQVERFARQYLDIDSECFDASTAWQAACTELLGEKYPNDPDVRRAVQANRLVRELAKKQGV